MTGRAVSLGFVFALVAVAIGACRPSAAEQGKEATKEQRDDGVDVKLTPKALEAAQLVTAKPKTVVRRTTVTVAGRVDFVPSRVARVGPSIAGRVATIPVVPGQRVGRGATLVTIDSVDVGRARADFLSAKTRADQTKAEVDRENRLTAGGASSERALLVAQADHATAQAQLHAAEDRLATLGLSHGGAGQAITLQAPMPGTILQIAARIGQPVGPTDTLVVVGETDQVWLMTDIYERDLGRVHVGDDVKVSSIAFPDRVFEGKVDHVGATVDPERHVLEARIVLSNTDGALKPGMMVSARILGADVSTNGNALVVPRQAVQTIDGQPFVFVEKRAGEYAMRPIQRGGEMDGDVEVSRGIVADETIVVDGAFILKSEALKAQMGAND